jgi:hypothetical protein
MDRARTKNQSQTSKAAQGAAFNANPGWDITSTSPRNELRPEIKMQEWSKFTDHGIAQRKRQANHQAHVQWWYDACLSCAHYVQKELKSPKRIWMVYLVYFENF